MQYLLIIKLLLLLFNAVTTSSAQIRRDHKKSNSNRNSIKYDFANDEKLDDDFNKCKRTSAEGLNQRSTSPRIPLYALQSEFNYDSSEIANSIQNETNNEEFKGRKPFKVASEMKIQPLIGETNNPPSPPRKADRKFSLNSPSSKNKSVDSVHSNDEMCDEFDLNDEKNLNEIKSDACKKIINHLFTDSSDEGIDLNVNELNYNLPTKSVRLAGVNTFVKLGGVKKSHNKIYKDVNMSLKTRSHESTDNPVPLKGESEKVFISSHNSRNDALHDVSLHQLHNMKIVQSYHPQFDDIGGSNETTTHDEGDVTTSGNLEKTTSNVYMGDLDDNDYPPINNLKLKKKKNFVYKDLNCILKTNLDNQESVLYCYKKRPAEDHRILPPRVMIGMPMPFGIPLPEMPPVRPQFRRYPQYKPFFHLNVPQPHNPTNMIPQPINAIKLNNIGFMML